MIKKINKKAEEATPIPLIVGLIVLLVSFGVLLYFLSRLNLGELTNEEICHNSVVLKSKTAGFAGSLDCRTDYVCISGGEECGNIDASSKIKVDASNKEEIIF